MIQIKLLKYNYMKSNGTYGYGLSHFTEKIIIEKGKLVMY